jgi:adenylate kinase
VSQNLVVTWNLTSWIQKTVRLVYLLVAPLPLLVEAITLRLKKNDCVDNGWVLEGFPINKAQADALVQKDIIPNRVFWLQASFETCKTRLIDRKYSGKSGRVVNLRRIPNDLKNEDFSKWITRPRDSEEIVNNRLNACKALRADLEKVFGVKTANFSNGIFAEISAEGIGEEDENGQQKSLMKVFEIVESALTRSVPISHKDK